jgi:OmpA-OmpF porin, OOP family
VASGLIDSGRVTLHGINFDSDTDTLRPDAVPTRDDLKQALAAHPDWPVTVEGYTDSRSTPAQNLELSQRRADAVMAHLVQAGIAAGNISVTGEGDADPVASNDTEIGRAQNRRVEIARQ